MVRREKRLFGHIFDGALHHELADGIDLADDVEAAGRTILVCSVHERLDGRVDGVLCGEVAVSERLLQAGASVFAARARRVVVLLAVAPTGDVELVDPTAALLVVVAARNFVRSPFPRITLYIPCA